ncbi:MAG: hypothetical protein ACM32O_12830 [Clostridia bacterium]
MNTIEDYAQNSLELLAAVIANWNQMQTSSMDEAGEDAERFETSFYQWIEQVRKWYESLDKKPADLAEALELPLVVKIAEILPIALYLNFETELELMIEGIERAVDEKYD